MVTVHKVEQGSDEWFYLRKGKITASNAGTLLMKGIYAANSNDGSSHSGNFWSNRGHILESEAIEIYEAVKGVKVGLAGFITNDRYPNAGYSPDGWEPLIEVKCFAAEKHLACLTEVPMPVYAQVQFGMMVSEKDDTDVVFYNPDIEDSKLCFKIVKVMRDERLIARFERILNGGENKKTTAEIAA